MRALALRSSFICCVAVAAPAQEREIVLADQPSAPALEVAGFRVSGFFVGSANYNSHVQIVPEFAGSAPVSSEPTRIDFRFDQLAIGINRIFAPWMFAAASIEIERHGHRHSHGFDPQFGCPGSGPCIEQFGTEPIDTDVSLHRFNVTGVVPVGNGLALSFGRFDTPFGYERHDAALNVTATTSELQRFGRPQSMTGLLASYPFSPFLDAVAWVVNRWENETTEDPPEDNNRAKSVGGRIGLTPLQGSSLLNFGIGGVWGPEQDESNSNARFIVDADVTWSTSSMVVAGELLYGGESGVSFRRRGTPFAADAIDGADVHWLGLYVLGHYEVASWLGVSLRYGLFEDEDGARTGIAQTLQSFTVTPIIHLSRLARDLRPRGVTYARTRLPIDWVDLRLEYRLGRSNRPVFSDAAPATPIVQAAGTGHVVTAQLVVNY
jgi:hypothetical protein